MASRRQTTDTARTRTLFGESILRGVADGLVIAGVPGSVYHLARGGMQAVFKNVPRICFYGAVFFSLDGAINYAMVAALRKEDHVLNGAVSTGGAVGIMALPKGVRHAGRCALIGAAFGGVLGAVVMHLEDPRRNLSPQAEKAADSGSSRGSVSPKTTA